jgi:hypothetical protein
MKIIFLALALGMSGAASAQTYSVIYTFPGTDTAAEALFRDSLGRFFGVTQAGGTCGIGTPAGFVYELRANKTLVDVRQFCNSNPGIQYPLIQDASGNLYGVRPQSGSNGGGVFELVKRLTGGYFYKNIWQFKRGFLVGVGGWGPQGKLTLDSAGNLYGTTGSGGHFEDGCSTTGCGVVYKLSPNSDGTWSETVLYAFVGNTDGFVGPSTDVEFDAAGNIYGANRNEQIFELSPNGSGGWKLAMRTGILGTPINPGLTFRSDGNLWFAGGFPDACGGPMYFNPTDQTVTAFGVLPHGGADGCGVFGAPVFDAAGNSYVVTIGGGTDSLGTVAKFEAGTGNVTVLHDFTVPLVTPTSGLLIDASGNLYGSLGGTAPNPTVIYKISNP